MNVRTTLPILVPLLAPSASVQAGGSAQHASAALNASANAVGHSMMAGAKLVSGALAITLGLVGAVGAASTEASDALWEEANTFHPLTVDDEVVTVGPPPAEALEQRE